MLVTSILGVISVFFAWLESSKQYRNGLKVSFILIFIFLSLRYNFGNDYMNYLNGFIEIGKNPMWGREFYHVKGNEIGWLYLNKLFYPLGFFAMQAFLAAITCFVLFKFIKKYVPPRYFWFAVFFYTFQPTMMLTLSSAMRQNIAVTFFLLSIDFIIQKKIVYYLILIFIATLFHTSAVFLYPFILIGFIKWRIKVINILILLILFTLPIIFVSKLYGFINLFVNQHFQEYSVYTVHGNVFEINAGLGFALNILIYLVILYYAQYETKNDNKILFKIAIMSLIMIPLSFGIHLISRLNMYLLPVMMAVFPFVFIRIRKSEIKLSFISVVVLFILYQFFTFFNSPLWIMHFSEYHTIFSAAVFY